MESLFALTLAPSPSHISRLFWQSWQIEKKKEEEEVEARKQSSTREWMEAAAAESGNGIANCDVETKQEAKQTNTIIRADEPADTCRRERPFHPHFRRLSLFVPSNFWILHTFQARGLTATDFTEGKAENQSPPQ